MKFNKLIYSFALTLLLIAGGVASASADEYYDRKVSLFELLPIGPDDIVFVGNSLTDGGEMAELLEMPNVKNRGIVSDVISGVDRRIATTLKGHPKKVFLLIGTNDVSHNLTAAQIAAKYEQLVKKMRSLSPQTHFYLQSVPPVNNDFKRYKSMAGKEGVIKALNAKIKEIAKANDCVFIDLTPTLTDPKTGKLRRDYTNDGLHFTGKGYKAWMGVVEPYVKEVIVPFRN